MTYNPYDRLEAVIRAVRYLMQGDMGRNLDSTQAIACEALVAVWTPGAYQIGDRRTHNGQVWRCCQQHDSAINPDVIPGQAPAHWVPDHATDPRWAKPFVQPTGAHDAYQTGECMVWTDGRVYRSTLDGNAYSPGDYPQGWEEVPSDAA